MLTNISGLNRTLRNALSPKAVEQRAVYADLARSALFRAYPSIKNFTAELCVLDAGQSLELFWSILDLGGPAPGGWHQVHDLKVMFLRPADGAEVTVPLSGHIAGFHAWYRMRGGMVPVMPLSFPWEAAFPGTAWIPCGREKPFRDRETFRSQLLTEGILPNVIVQ